MVNKLKIDQKLSKRKVVYFCILDVLLMPYFPRINILLSMIILIFWYIKKINQLIKDREVWLILIFGIFGILSIIIGCFYKHTNYQTKEIFFTNFIYFAICFYSVLYLYFFKINLVKYNININIIFKIYIFITALFACIYWINPYLYFQIRSHWTINQMDIESINLFINRFTFIESDPNSISCIICSMFLYLLFTNSVDKIDGIFMILLVGISVIASMSTTGIIMYIFTILMMMIKFISDTFKEGRKYISNVDLIKKLFKFLLPIITVLLFSMLLMKNYDVFFSALSRYQSNYDSNSLGGRTEIWKEFFTDFILSNYIFVGKGHMIFNNFNALYAPHNGHFYLILSYGFIGYLVYIYLMFRKVKKVKMTIYISIIPLFVLFTINTLVIDIRAAFALSLIVASIFYSSYYLKTPRK